ncbi:MAG: peptidylprolyl isomerase, partial [Planctomycetaceae bacterium]|nr:peptidylprolyl isomerase [Planctomycetaceae bacterium]
GFYDGQCFHRIIDGFMIQGGDPLTKNEKEKANYGTGGPGYNIDAEFNNRKHVRGVISMARGSDPNSAGSQFFICLGNTPQLDGKYTAFGNLVLGDGVLEKLGKEKVGFNALGNEKSVPLNRVSIESIRFQERPIPASGK